ncbi:MAG: hypothetical protein U1F43_00855 [Myxococcota bacterium]
MSHAGARMLDRITRRAPSLATLVALMGGLAGACDGGSDALRPDRDATAATAPDADATQVVPDAGDAFDPSSVDQISVGPTACCLTMDGMRAVWSEGGDLWMVRLDTGKKEPLVVAPGVQKDPVLDGDRLVWADQRGGDFDLWTLTFANGVAGQPVLLRGGAGDQDQPAVSGSRVVWIGRDNAPYSPLEAEVYALDLRVANSERRLTTDAFEQTQPDVDGDKVVWADYSLSVAGQYLPEADPLRNNADILGFDLATGLAFEVTRDPSKQLAPTIDGDVIAWLDWRGINPEPKYSEFQVFARRLGDPLERRLAWSSWDRPELWRRPAVAHGIVVFIAEPTTPMSGFATSVLAVRADGGEPWLVSGSTSVLDSVVTDGENAAWIGAGTLGHAPVESLQPAVAGRPCADRPASLWSPIMRPTPSLALCLLALAACGDDAKTSDTSSDSASTTDATVASDVVPDALDDSVADSADAPDSPDTSSDAPDTSSDAPDAPDAVDPFDRAPATLRVTERAYVGNPAQTNVGGTLWSAEPPENWVLQAEDGPCKLWFGENPFCSVPCEGALCTAVDECTPYPAAESAGTLTISDGATPVDYPFNGTGYGELKDGALFAAGATVTFSAPGDAFPAFSGSVVMPPKLVPGDLTALDLDGAEPLTITWEPPAAAGAGDTQVRIRLQADRGQHGRLPTAALECVVSDTGSFTIPEDLRDQYSAESLWGCGKCPQSFITRFRRTRVAVGDAGAHVVDLWAESEVPFLLTPWSTVAPR